MYPHAQWIFLINSSIRPTFESKLPLDHLSHQFGLVLSLVSTKIISMSNATECPVIDALAVEFCNNDVLPSVLIGPAGLLEVFCEMDLLWENKVKF